MLATIDQGLRGIDNGFDRLDKAAGRIARDGAGADLAGTVVDLMRARQDVATNVAVVRTADEMIGSLLDLFA
jgi:hypothetical protein